MSRPRARPDRSLADRIRRLGARTASWCRLSIRRRILLVMLAVSVIPLAIFSLAGMAALSGLNGGALKTANSELEASQNAHLQDLVQSKALVINNELESVQGEVELISQSTGERLAQIPSQATAAAGSAQTGAEEVALKSLDGQLALVYQLHPEVADVWVQLPASGLTAVSPASAPGVPAATLSELSPPAGDYQAGLTRQATDLNSPHWRSLVSNSAQSLVWTPVYNNPATGGPTVTVAIETASANGIEFWVGANLTVKNLVSNFLTRSPGHSEGGYAFLVSSDGALLSYAPGGAADLGLGLKQRRAAAVNLVSQKSPWYAVGNSMRDGLDGHQTINLAGEPVAVFYSPLPASQWSLGVGIPVSGIDGSVVGFSQTITHGLVGVTALLLPFLLILAALAAVMTDILSRRLLHPLSALTGAARRIAGGDLQTPVPVTPGPADEIGILELALEGMRKRISGQHQLIEAAQRNLEQRVEERTTELRQRNGELAILNSVSADLSRSLVLSDVASSAAQQLRNLWEVSEVSVYMSDGMAPRGIRLVGRSGDDQPGEHGNSELSAALEQSNQSAGAPVQVDDLVVVPLQVTGNRVGYLVLRQGQVAGRRQVEMLAVVGGQLALALRNAQLYADTQEMATLNERNRIAREIHDTLAQGLTGILVQLQAAGGWLEREPVRARRAMDQATELARSSLQEARRSVWDLRPGALQRADLAAAVREELARVQARTRVRTSLEVHGLDQVHLPPQVELAAFRIAQEAIANSLHHARPSEIEVVMSRRGQTLAIQISDNGGGFDPEAQVRPEAFGITSMRERASACGGTLELSSRAGQGTRIVLRLPCETPAPSRASG
ncbi:MAG TPA: histidine kinase [Candidatus Acidoferrales bacterium]|nr:histidine kinase [Candidatus Acidoferrales bacterium]